MFDLQSSNWPIDSMQSISTTIKNMISPVFGSMGFYNVRVDITEDENSSSYVVFETSIPFVSISIPQVKTLCETAKLAPFVAVRKIVFHEVLHVVLSSNEDMSEFPDSKLLNIAQDLHINSLIDIKKPFLHPESFGLPANLNWKQYYKLIENEMKSDSTDTRISDLMDPDSDASDGLCSFDGKERSTISSDIAEKVERLVVKNLSSKNQYDSIINTIKFEESQIELVPTRKVPSYKKYNKRNTGANGSVIYPGKKYSQRGVKKKYDRSAVAFIDISFSTNGEVWQNLIDAAFELHNSGCTIVYYNTNLVGVVKPDESFYAFAPTGGTSIGATVEKYIADYGEIKRGYIISDGEDNYNRLEKFDAEFSLWVVDKNGKFDYFKNPDDFYDSFEF